jgi:hypothetical protein
MTSLAGRAGKARSPYIFDEIGHGTLIAVFETRVNRLKWVIEREGEYFHL